MYKGSFLSNALWQAPTFGRATIGESALVNFRLFSAAFPQPCNVSNCAVGVDVSWLKQAEDKSLMLKDSDMQ
jgi:hypothetical protein